MLNKWLLLSDAEDQAGVRGYLKICMAILGPGADAPVSGSIYSFGITLLHLCKELHALVCQMIV